MSPYLIWILGSSLILSNSQSYATLWVLDTCLIIGLRPLVIIFITASLSSKIYNWACTEKKVRLWSHDLDFTTDATFRPPFFNLMLWTLSRQQCPAAPLDLLLGVEIFWVGGALFDER